MPRPVIAFIFNMLFSISTFAAVSAFASAALGAALPVSANPNTVAKRALTGEATFYGGNTSGGQCSFTEYTLPSGVYGTALSDSNWSNAANCGACVSVKGPNGKSITAMITDQCPGCGTNHLDLYENAFTQLAAKSAGIINVSWDYVACPITSPLSIHMKSGVSQYWFSAQVVNAKRRTTKLEVSTDSGKTWKAAARTTYNFFEISSGSGATSAWIRVTSETGSTVTVKNVSQAGDVRATATANYA
ncbi:barwin-like endoglucanase [Aureobasidium pullulans]|uniref:Barwin-like endoglucanase n=1 Tax=Aureobasidium pullulans TaxID=5580 RepID=A0AB74K0J9_AURPU|nr:barwin-like endoglucanase [Aureobasidium pullulans]THX65391.1 barwin-like endoglucanase [Aureobasidium pullulans]